MVEDATAKMSNPVTKPQWAKLRTRHVARRGVFVSNGEQLVYSVIPLEPRYFNVDIQVVHGVVTNPTIIKYDAYSQVGANVRQKIPYWKWLGGDLWEDFPSVYKVLEKLEKGTEGTTTSGVGTEDADAAVLEVPESPEPPKVSNALRRRASSGVVRLKVAPESLGQILKVPSNSDVAVLSTGPHHELDSQSRPLVKKEDTSHASVIDLTDDELHASTGDVVNNESTPTAVIIGHAFSKEEDYDTLRRNILSASCWTSSLPVPQCHVEVQPF